MDGFSVGDIYYEQNRRDLPPTFYKIVSIGTRMLRIKALNSEEEDRGNGQYVFRPSHEATLSPSLLGFKNARKYFQKYDPENPPSIRFIPTVN